MIKLIVVVFGNAGHGKNTLADMIAEELTPCEFGDDCAYSGVGSCFVDHPRALGVVRRASFADPLKRAAKELIGIPLEVSYATAAVKESTRYYDRTARHWLQWLGTDIGRNFIHPDVWVHRLADEALSMREGVMVVSDGRFENERTQLHERLGGVAQVCNVFVYRPSVPVNLSHPSESGVYAMRCRALEHPEEPLFAAIIVNDGTLKQLREQARSFAGAVRKMRR